MTCIPAETQRDKTSSYTLDKFDKQDTPSEGKVSLLYFCRQAVLLKVIKAMKQLPRAAHSCK
jgi:hypothetical protein